MCGPIRSVKRALFEDAIVDTPAVGAGTDQGRSTLFAGRGFPKSFRSRFGQKTPKSSRAQG
jgi:hypothetical protein